MSGGGASGSGWVKALVLGLVLVGVAQGLHHFGVGSVWLFASLLAIGGLLVVFGSCEAMIVSVEGIGERAGWNGFVAGTMAGLASNLPEVVMLGFVLAAAPRVGFIVEVITLHVGALAFGIYSALLPHDKRGFARLPEPLVQLSTDLYATAAGTFLATGLVMLCMRAFEAGEHGGSGLSTTDLYVLAGVLLAIEAVAMVRLVQRFSGASGERPADGDLEQEDDYRPPKVVREHREPPALSRIVGFGLLGVFTSVVGGHAVGDFADILVHGVEAAGYPEMVGPILLSVFSCTGGYVMIATARDLDPVEGGSGRREAELGRDGGHVRHLRPDAQLPRHARLSRALPLIDDRGGSAPSSVGPHVSWGSPASSGVVSSPTSSAAVSSLASSFAARARLAARRRLRSLLRSASLRSSR